MSSKITKAGICPSFFIELSDIKELLSEYGPFSGKYIAKYPNRWLNDFDHHIKNLNPLDQLAAKKFRDSLKYSLVQEEAKYEEELNWAENAKNNLLPKGISPIVGDCLNPSPFHSWKDSLDEIRDTRQRSWRITGKWGDYITLIEPLLLNAPSAVIVDRYFDPCSYVSQDILKAIFEKIKGSKCYEINVVTRKKVFNQLSIKDENSRIRRPVSEIVHLLDSIYSNVVPKDRVLKFHFVFEDKKGGEYLRMHNRYFLTNHGGIDFGIGFEIVDSSIPQVDAYVIDKPHLAVLKETYFNGVCRSKEKLPKQKGIAYPIDLLTHIIR